jgi:hypothetical protein
MRRDYFQLAVHNVETAGEKPTVVIDFTGPSDLLRERLKGLDGELLEASETDVAYRLQSPLGESEPTGVVSLTNRATGEFILELNEAADDVLRFIRSAREYGKSAGDDDGRYRIKITIDGDTVADYSKSTFLVYDADGSLLRSKSLIPSGVEL